MLSGCKLNAGIDKLIKTGVYNSAFPLNDVCYVTLLLLYLIL